MRFKYSFQKIVDLKNNEKKQEQWLLSNELGILAREESRLTELQHQKQVVQDLVAAGTEKKMAVSELLLAQKYIDHIDRQIRRKQQDVLAARQSVTDRQKRLSAKALEEKMWNMAREKAYQTFTALLRKKEQDELDEIATVRHKHLT